LIIGVPKEIYPGERRVALVPLVVPNLIKAGFEIVIETGAGVEAGYPDAFYAEKGAKILPTRADIFKTADIITQVLCYGANDRSKSDRFSASARFAGSGRANCRHGSDSILR
jgi:NAD(P) transhydrogenase subunit alpha